MNNNPLQISNGTENETFKPDQSSEVQKICCNETETEPVLEKIIKQKSPLFFFGICIVVASVIVGGTIVYTSQPKDAANATPSSQVSADLEKTVLPSQGIILPVAWNDMGKRLVESGVIDQKKFEDLYAQRGGLDEQTKKLLTCTDNGRIVITKDNANALLNLLWALGLANKNTILENGQMTAKQFGGDPSKFASTAGWTLAVGKTMDH